MRSLQWVSVRLYYDTVETSETYVTKLFLNYNIKIVIRYNETTKIQDKSHGDESLFLCKVNKRSWLKIKTSTQEMEKRKCF